MDYIGLHLTACRHSRTGAPGRRVLIAVALIFGGGIGTLGCARPNPPPRHLPAWVFESGQSTKSKWSGRHIRPRDGIRGRSDASDLVVTALQETGLRFATDGSVGALWGYLRTSHKAVSPADTRLGDVLFFQTRAQTGTRDGRGCDSPDHVAIVDAVDRDGRIRFAEARDGEIRQSFVDPMYPDLRRDDQGRVLNSFLRPKRIGDPDDGALLAGEMLCAAVRPAIRPRD